MSGVESVAINHPIINVAGRDNVVHNHYNLPGVRRPSPKNIEELMDLIPNFRQIYQDMLSKVTEGTGMWLLNDETFRIWIEPDGTIKILWGSGIRK